MYKHFIKRLIDFWVVFAVLLIILFVSMSIIFVLSATDRKLMQQQKIANQKLKLSGAKNPKTRF